VAEGTVAVVEMHRPPHNYFDVRLIEEIADQLDRADRDPHCRAVVLCSEGRNFCAGAQIGSGPSDPTRDPAALYRAGLRLFHQALPVVAAVQGAAVGGGLGLALAADFRVAAPDSRFDCNFARLGFHHGFGITVTLPEVVGRQVALRMLMTGATLRGQDALAAGLCDRLARADGLRTAALTLAEEIAACGPLAVRAIRRTMRAGLAERVREATEVEAAAQLELVGSEDFAEGTRAMAERRAPRFRGR